ncbi:ferritin-like domain-containing protein [Chryseobacterium wangxinyae]|uniref:ferritin-like domain-containing protein n=1 Tax=unclassified Chryseobacterium TaxID=2593645 RepID=UPI00227020D4|nr:MULTISPECIES: PA2169 family four-helix-bundle protein [unclassified Chryseobacterium]MCY0970464.1 PA2169 family four-helix-bundle protein [Chryseobacterium sp. CY353]MCY0976504.1 PA2169 family four-helix-bundle protein [Chryseobacterium sp. CY350]WBZ96508.1 PA2169 family four-helix-bundle protein [Chryseobacterium sp. CY350]
MDNSKTVSTLNDLLNITNDRIQGFSKVEDKVWETYSPLKNDYDQMVMESQKMKSDLISLITERGGTPDDTSTTAGALHRTWIDVKNSFGGDNTESTLENVVFGERAAIDAYQEALQSGDLCPQSTVVVADQLQNLKSSYAKFETLERTRD